MALCTAMRTHQGLTKVIFDAMDAELRPAHGAVAPRHRIPRRTRSRRRSSRRGQLAAAQLRHRLGAGVLAAQDPPPSPRTRCSGGSRPGSKTRCPWTWLRRLVGVFQTWAPTTADGVSLKNAITAASSGKPEPEQLRGSSSERLPSAGSPPLPHHRGRRRRRAARDGQAQREHRADPAHRRGRARDAARLRRRPPQAPPRPEQRRAQGHRAAPDRQGGEPVRAPRPRRASRSRRGAMAAPSSSGSSISCVIRRTR